MQRVYETNCLPIITEIFHSGKEIHQKLKSNAVFLSFENENDRESILCLYAFFVTCSMYVKSYYIQPNEILATTPVLLAIHGYICFNKRSTSFLWFV